MSRIIGLAAAAALLVSMSAYAQNSDSQNQPVSAPAAGSEPTRPSGAPDGASKVVAGMHHHHAHHHMQRTEGSASTDNDADKLNACRASANPTPEQQQCLHRAENSPS